ncbi:MAG: hypothetical protein IID61_09470, partial [SAR324 cluster bacterium]|nr:hypothetical protein [SAR324 cluster bacterium]
MNLQEIINASIPARLFPIVGDSSLERRAVSIFLSVLARVYPFRRELLGSIARRVGVRSRVDVYEEVRFPSDEQNDRPDGLIRIQTGNNTWTALLEAKVDTTELDRGQIESYLRIDREYRIDALITISNQFVPMPTHSPVNVSGMLTKSVDMFHWSWSFILTHATMLQNSEDFESEDQKYLLDELIRYFGDDRRSLRFFEMMHQNWKSFVTNVQSNAVIKKSDPHLEETVSDWHEEIRDISLKLSRKAQIPISVRMSAKHRADPRRHLADDVAILAKNYELSANLNIPNAASNLDISANLKNATVTCSMSTNAPENSRAVTRIKKLLECIIEADDKDVFVEVYWPKGSKATQESLAIARKDPEALVANNKSLLPIGFRVKLVKHLGGRFSSRKKFIQELEAAVVGYYENIGENLI